MRLITRNQFLGADIFLIPIALGVMIPSRAGPASIRDIVTTLSVIFGTSLMWSQAGAPEQWRPIRFLVSIISSVILLSLGILLFVARRDPPTILLRGGLVGAVTVADVLFVLAPLWLRTPRDLSASQAQQVRDVGRADIVAHLHDFALQTPTLIRASAKGPKKAWALTLSKERELCSWFHIGRSEAASSLVEAVRQSVGVLESKFGVPVEVVTVSDMKPRPTELALVTALGEAVTNAPCHRGPPVSVYPEARTEKIEVFVKNYGNGLDSDSIPHDRHGARDPIVGKMERVGGKAHIHVRLLSTEIALEVSKEAKNIPCDAPNIIHDVSSIPHGVPNTRGVS